MNARFSASQILLALALAGVSVLLLSAGSQRRGKGKIPPVEYWTGTLAEARQNVRERNIPLVVHAILEGEERNDAYRDMLPDPALQEASQLALVLVANNGKHERKKVRRDRDGTVETLEVCAAYGTPRCADHQRLFDEFYAEFKKEDGELDLPQTLVALPSGDVVLHFDENDPPPIATMVGALKQAKKKTGPGITAAQLVTVRGRAQVAATNGRAGEWTAAWRGWQSILEITEHGTHADRAREGIPKAEAGMRKSFEALSARLVPGTAAEAYAELLAFSEALAGVPLQSQVRKSLKKAERDKAIREEIEAWKVAQEAEELWRKAQAAFASNQNKTGEKTIRRLLRTTKYAETPAVARAREEYPRWADEEDAKRKQK